MNPEDLIRSTLTERAPEGEHGSTPMSDIRGNARMLQRRRWATGGLAAAAVIAVVAVPAAVMLPGRDRAVGPADPATTSASDTPTGPSTPTSVSPLGSLADVPKGEPPHDDYLLGATYHPAGGGDTLHVADPGNVAALTWIRGGLLVGYGDGDFGKLTLYTPQAQELGCGSTSFAITPDGVESAYWTRACGGGRGTLSSGVNNTMGESGPQGVSTGDWSTTPVGFLDGQVVARETLGIVGKVYLVDPGTGHGQEVPGLIAASGVSSTGLIAGESDRDTWVVVDRNGDVKWTTTYQLGHFSPDGHYVWAVQRNDGVPDDYVVLDASTGDVVRHLGHDLPPMTRLSDPVWEDESHLLAVTSAKDQAILRYGVDGTVERATAVTSDPIGYRLATRP